MIHIHVVILILHHGIKIVIVGHTDGHRVRVGLTQIVSRIEGHPCLFVLIPIDGRVAIVERNTVKMVHRIFTISEEFPSIAKRLIEAGIHLRCRQTDSIARQYGWWRIEHTDSGQTALQLQMDVHHVQFIRLLDTAVVFILIVGILIDHGDDLLLGQVIDIALTADVERRQARRFLTLDDKVLLVVGQAFIFCLAYDTIFLRARIIILITIILLSGMTKRHTFYRGMMIQIGIIDHLSLTVWNTHVIEILLSEINRYAICLWVHTRIVALIVLDNILKLFAGDARIFLINCQSGIRQ